MEKIQKAVVYARYSSDNQREESIDAQVRAMKEYASRNNIIIVGEYLDRALSATTDHRPEFLRMIEDSKNGEWSMVMVHKLDRFARNRYHALLYKRELMRNGVCLRSVTENIDDSPESIILESVLQGMNEYYSKNLAREVMKGQKENALKCVHTGGQPPYGFSIDKETKQLVINEEEAKIVRLIFDRIINGSGYQKIVQELNGKGYRTRRGTEFTINFLSTMVGNQKYAGIYVYNRSASKDIDGKRNGHKYKPEDEWIVIEGGCPAIISKEDFEYVQKKREANKNKFLGHNKKEDYLLTGKIVCGECGGMYVGECAYDKRRVKAYIKYNCNMKRRKGADFCSSKPIYRDALEKYTLQILADELFCDAMQERIIGYYNQSIDILNADKIDLERTLKNRLRKTQQDIETLIDMITKTQSEALLGRLAKLEETQKQLTAELAMVDAERDEKKATEEQLRESFLLAKTLLRKGGLDNIKKVIETFVKQITIFEDGIVIEFNFARKRDDLSKPRIDRHLPIREQVRKMQSELTENGQKENQCIDKTMHWRGGEGGI